MIARSLIAIPVLLAACCAGEPGTSGALPFDPALKTLVIVQVRGVLHPPSTDGLAWCFFAGGDSGSPGLIEGLLAAADSAGMLLMLVEQEPFIELSGLRQHVFLKLDDTHRPVAISPEGLEAELEGLHLTPDPQGQEIILGLREKYRPDIVFISVNPPGDGLLDDLTTFWADAALTRDIRFILFSTPSPEGRGWCAMNWRGIPGSFIPGLTFGGFLKTVAILAGLPWDPSAFSGVPAATLLMEQTR